MNNALLEHYKMHRPILHYSVKNGWMNDPNGLFYKDGFYHLYYQYYPNDIKHGPMHWGHARSTNLLDWENLPIALYPDKNGVAFSGSIVDDKNNTTGLSKKGKSPIVAIYTSHLDVEGRVSQSQSIALSYDGGMSFDRYENNPVLNLHMRDFRDPKVIWHDETKKWIMPLVAGRKVMFFQSDNLINWVSVSTFESKNDLPTGIWE